MKIEVKDLRTDLPPVIHYPDGSVNVVLAFHNDSYYGPTNTYLPRWSVSNAVYYHKNLDKYVGWIELENIPSPEFK
jgi:hypothetical protein